MKKIIENYRQDKNLLLFIWKAAWYIIADIHQALINTGAAASVNTKRVNW